MPESLRVLLDEAIPEQLRTAFSDTFVVETVRYQGWAGMRNGDLLRAAEAQFDIQPNHFLVTVIQRS